MAVSKRGDHVVVSSFIISSYELYFKGIWNFLVGRLKLEEIENFRASRASWERLPSFGLRTCAMLGKNTLCFGRRGKDVPSSKLLDYALGYTLFNDVSIRDSDLDKGGFLSFAFAKNFEGAGSLGPCIVLKDEIEDPQNVEFTTFVNGEKRQNGNTKDMIRSFGEFIELLSADNLINPGDVLCSGTSAGTAADSTPANSDGVQDPLRFLKVGDEVEVRSDRIGSLKNKVIEKPLH